MASCTFLRTCEKASCPCCWLKVSKRVGLGLRGWSVTKANTMLSHPRKKRTGAAISISTTSASASASESSADSQGLTQDLWAMQYTSASAQEDVFDGGSEDAFHASTFTSHSCAQLYLMLLVNQRWHVSPCDKVLQALSTCSPRTPYIYYINMGFYSLSAFEVAILCSRSWALIFLACFAVSLQACHGSESVC